MVNLFSREALVQDRDRKFFDLEYARVDKPWGENSHRTAGTRQLIMSNAVRGLLVLIIACFAGACEQRPAETVANKERERNAVHPTTLADINGWHGVEVARQKVNTWVECRLSFPADFGSAQEEKTFLVYLVSRRSDIEDKSCQFSPVGAYQALNQLLHLAADKQDPIAARILLFQDFLGVSLKLDGEVAEGYTEDYLVPVLEKYEKLDTVLDQARESVIAKDICANLQWREDIKDTKFKNRIKKLVEQLNAKGMGGLARQIQACK